MYKMNQKGQTFSTFKLLISAIVAIAILTMLFQIMGLVNFGDIGKQDPQSKAIELVQNAQKQLTVVKTAPNVVFKKDDTITSYGISQQNIGYDKEQICVTKGDIVKETLESDGVQVTYNGSASLKMTIKAVCGNWNSEFTEYLTSVGFPSTGECSSLPSDQEVCIVALSK